MSSQVDLQNIEDIKIPFPTEGVIRTEQLDDTIAPTNSVQLAVNMNFDRVGAIQTRPGVTEFADSLAEAISNYGTLKNTSLSDGYLSISQVGANNDITSTVFTYSSAVLVSSTKVAVFWADGSSVGKCQNFALDEATGALTALGSVTTFDAVKGTRNKAILVHAGVVLNTWAGTSDHGYTQAFDVSGDTIVAYGSALNFDASNGTHIGVALVDSTHVICFYRSSAGDGVATIFALDGSNNVTQPGSPTTFESGTAGFNAPVAVGDGTHFINYWSGATQLAQCFSVNTGTWAITALSSPLNAGTAGQLNNAFAVGDGQHFVNIFETSGLRLGAQCFSLNLSTFALTAVGTPISTGAVVAEDLAVAGFTDGYHFTAMYSINPGAASIQMIELNPSTFDMTFVGNILTGYVGGPILSTSAIGLTAYKTMFFWKNNTTTFGQAAMIEAFGDLVYGNWLYAGHTDKVSNTPAPGGAWTTRRSGLAQVSKPRFSQYLNYIWMVNGNSLLGGDPVATSNGGAFGTDLVPVDFPPGDFIHAGFEGRVWVADKTQGVIYYSDIVQFSPPATYTLTYDSTVNFITTLSPQTGDEFTALKRVPRALLVFTENTITRIYGATSVDAYPAYNVGTYSQESIVTTKTGIYFHHSSGFYQFDYGSQPVEISRRIIDFVKAIPRASYDDITGVYDGYDVVEWSVGQVTVEGVVFSNCVLRYTISTQVWTIYDYTGNTITAMISYDNGVSLSHLMGTQAGLTGALDTGTTDFGESFYFEYIDRWRAFTDMYYKTKSISGFNVYNENAAGANFSYQEKKSGPNAWIPLGNIDENANSLMPSAGTDDFDVIRFRIAGNTSGAQVVLHCIEITQLTIKGQEIN